MMMKRILSLLLLAFVHTKSALIAKSTSQFTLPPPYKSLDVSDPINVRIFNRGLRSVGVVPIGITLKSLGVRGNVLVSHYLALFENEFGLECALKFSSGLFSGIRGRFQSCIKSVTVAPAEQPTTNEAPLSTTTTTESSEVVVKNESTGQAELSMIDLNTGVDNDDDEPEVTSEVVEKVKKEETVVVNKKSDESSSVSDTKKVQETDSKKNKKSRNKVEAAVSVVLEKAQDAAQNLLGSSKKSADSNLDVEPNTQTQTKVSAVLNGNLEVDTLKSTSRSAAPKPVKKIVPVEDKVVKLCFDDSLFVKTAGKWVPSSEGC